MIIREASLSDLDSIYILEKECFINPWKKEDLVYELTTNPINKIFVALVDDKIVGYIDYMITFNSSTISKIAVLKDYRGQGIASSLLNKMIDLLPKSGDDIVEFITLEVRAKNINAINLYKKFDFENVTIKSHYYPDGEDALYMVRRM